MLTTLRIKNLALVSDLTLGLEPGYNAITGETGAGKSIIIGALNLVLGERADRTLIRSGAESCSVEAVFDLSKLHSPIPSFLSENGLEPCEEGQMVLKRIFTAAGANRQFINGSPATLQTLAALGEWLVDMHGPHDHQSLLHPSRQLIILDAFGGLRELREEFAALVVRRGELEARKKSLVMDDRTHAQQLDLLRFQVNEIETAKLRAEEEAEVGQAYQVTSNAARLLQLAQVALNLLSEGEGDLISQAGAVGRTLSDLQKIDPEAAPLAALHGQAVDNLRELQAGLANYAERLEIDPARLHALEERLNLLHSLKRKYGSTLAEVIAFAGESRAKLVELEGHSETLAEIDRDMAALDIRITEKGAELSRRRRKLIPKLNEAATRQLADLGFQRCHFDAALHTDELVADSAGSHSGARMDAPRELRQTGFDRVEFQFSPNTGEPPRPLRAIASSGEMARVMLALKTVLASEDAVPVLVFDEVDANVGGETARVVGEKMRRIARQHQVLCITHLAPVAAAASTHYLVSKEVREGRTISEIRPLSRRERVEELARMLGGASDPARKHAEALLKAAQ
jgi:DNA repair protein RecN (Recombination protein N)